MPRKSLYLSGDPKADDLLTKDPLALLIGMVLDQQVPLEWAFRGPAELVRRLGAPLDAAAVATMDPDVLVEAFTRKPALHRYPGSMAARVQALCRLVAEDYAGDPARIWRDAADAHDLLARLKALPGFGEQKARIFVALLGKQLDLSVSGWETASSPFGEPGTFRSVADIVDPASLDRVRQYKQAMKAEKAAGTKAKAAGTKAKAAGTKAKAAGGAAGAAASGAADISSR